MWSADDICLAFQALQGSVTMGVTTIGELPRSVVLTHEEYSCLRSVALKPEENSQSRFDGNSQPCFRSAVLPLDGKLSLEGISCFQSVASNLLPILAFLEGNSCFRSPLSLEATLSLEGKSCLRSIVLPLLEKSTDGKAGFKVDLTLEKKSTEGWFFCFRSVVLPLEE